MVESGFEPQGSDSTAWALTIRHAVSSQAALSALVLLEEHVMEEGRQKADGRVASRFFVFI